MAKARGFTLIELLVVLAIVGVITAIAVPQFKSYRERSYDVRAESDLRNVAVAEEAYFLDHEQYLSCANTSCTGLPGIARLSQGTQLTITAQLTEFSGTSSHARGSGKVFQWDSAQGGFY